MFPLEGSEEAKIAYARTRFRGWLVTCFELGPAVRLLTSLWSYSGVIVFRSPDGLTIAGLVGEQLKSRHGTLGVSLVAPSRAGVKDEIAVGLGPAPYDTHALLWALAQHWMVCRCRDSGTGGRYKCMCDALLLDKWHPLTILHEDDHGLPTSRPFTGAECGAGGLGLSFGVEGEGGDRAAPNGAVVEVGVGFQTNGHLAVARKHDGVVRSRWERPGSDLEDLRESSAVYLGSVNRSADAGC